MYAVISSGGKQYRLTEGDLVDVERIGGHVGDPVVFDRVLFLGDGDSGRVGDPVVDGARVLGTIVTQGKGDKIIVFKFKRRKMYRRKNGHRQELTRVRIESIQPEGKPVEVAAEKAPRPVEEVAAAEAKPAKEPRKAAKTPKAVSKTAKSLPDEVTETTAAAPSREAKKKAPGKAAEHPSVEPAEE
jgi:large subunit ribosomal protein L21